VGKDLLRKIISRGECYLTLKKLRHTGVGRNNRGGRSDVTEKLLLLSFLTKKNAKVEEVQKAIEARRFGGEFHWKKGKGSVCHTEF